MRLRHLLLLAAILTLVPAAGAAPLDDPASGLEPPAIAAAAPPVPQKPNAFDGPVTGPPVIKVRLGPTGHHATGALTGKTVYLSPGHGWVWGGSAWETQRGNTNGLVEDLSNAESVDQFLVDQLRNMGAHVVPVREVDLTAAQFIVDDAQVVADGVTLQASTAAGYGAVTLPITSDAVNPFTAGGTSYVPSSSTETGRAVYPLTALPAAGYYNVYVSYAQGANRVSDAHYIVRHAGGESHFRVDQRRHGSTWVLLGRYWFDPADPVERLAVAVANDSADAASGAVVSLDAVRLGGGVGLMDRGGGVLARPGYEICARYYAQLSGAPASVFAYTSSDRTDDVGTRSRFAAWDHETGEDAVYLSWHTNAPNPGRGTESYTYGPDAPPGPLSHFSGVAGSLDLQAAVHGALIADLRAAWDPAWQDRGMFTAYFGEINPTHNPEMPAMLVEVAFHDTPEDAAAIKDPRFRRVVARAMAKGIARYFADRDGVAVTLPPEPPAAVRVENDGAGALLVSWRPPAAAPAGGDAPASYRVYTSRDGLAFDDGVAVVGEAATLAGLAPGDVRFVRVAAVNAGGESLPAAVVGARVAAAGQAPVLIVGGFDRLEASLLPTEDLSAYGLGQVQRLRLDRLNDGTYAARHGLAIAAAAFSFDGAEHGAVQAADVDLARYQAVDWFLGEESTHDVPLDPGERDALGRFLAAGGRLFLSGSEIGWAMVARGSAEEQAFYRDVLHATYVSDDAGTATVTAPDGPYAGLADFAFDDPGPQSYAVEYPDVIAPGADATLALGYGGGAGGAAIAWTGAAGDRGVMFGFPFETITGAATRADVMARTLAYLGVTEPAPPDDAGTPDDAAVPPDDAGVDATPGPDAPAPPGGGGCGCRAAPAPAAPLVLLLVAVALAATRRRR
ncbi:MAG TPA: N-acetylmuramoyl-L-alanine amidase [Polyangia bacterium]|jgi:MYXO-CTERM domain-containing protein